VQRFGALALVVCVLIVVLGLSLGRHRKRLFAQKPQIKEFDPNSLLFSLPTICDEAPPTVQSAGHDNSDAFRMHEDDWRQIEFIAREALPQIDHEMADLEAFKTANRAPVGWKKVYVRTERRDGLSPSRLPYGLVDSIPHGATQTLTIGTPGQEMAVEGGFAARLGPTLFMYGRQSQGVLVDLGLNRSPNENESTQTQSLLALCKKFNLVIVDWCAGRVIGRP